MEINSNVPDIDYGKLLDHLNAVGTHLGLALGDVLELQDVDAEVERRVRDIDDRLSKLIGDVYDLAKTVMVLAKR